MFGMGKKSKDKKSDDKTHSTAPPATPVVDSIMLPVAAVTSAEPANVPEPIGLAQQPMEAAPANSIVQPPEADFVIVFAKTAEGSVTRGPALNVTADDGFVTLGGGVATAGSGGVIGESYTVRLPDAFEARASGKKIRMTVLARATAEPVNFHLAYSTNEVGNSGWNKFEAGEAFAEHSFEWSVPPMKEGRGDFAGVQPPLAGEGQIDLAWIALTIE
jgi:hypothetical protein